MSTALRLVMIEWCFWAWNQGVRSRPWEEIVNSSEQVS